MVDAHQKVVEAQFGPQARAYVESAVHASGADLDAVEALVRKLRPERALDLGAGGGHVAYMMARHARLVCRGDGARQGPEQYRDGRGSRRATPIRRFNV